jgi:hypothetical protein
MTMAGVLSDTPTSVLVGEHRLLVPKRESELKLTNRFLIISAHFTLSIRVPIKSVLFTLSNRVPIKSVHFTLSNRVPIKSVHFTL